MKCHDSPVVRECYPAELWPRESELSLEEEKVRMRELVEAVYGPEEELNEHIQRLVEGR